MSFFFHQQLSNKEPITDVSQSFIRKKLPLIVVSSTCLLMPSLSLELWFVVPMFGGSKTDLFIGSCLWVCRNESYPLFNTLADYLFFFSSEVDR